MIHKLMRYQVRKEAVPQALAAARALVDEVTRKEGGTARYEAWHEAADPTRFEHRMAFRTPSAEKYHEGTAWRKKFQDAVAPLCVAPPATIEIAPVGVE